MSDYLRPLCKNQYSIDDTEKFPNMLSSIPLLQDVKEDVPCYVESLFTNILREEKTTLLNKSTFKKCSHLFVRN